MKQNKHYILFFYFYILFIGHSCTQVDLCHEEIHPHGALLSFNFDWTNHPENKSENMYVLLSRIINTRHYVFSVHNTSEKEIDEPEEKYEAKENRFHVESGDYSILAVNINEDYTNVNQLEEFSRNTALQLNDIELSLTSYQKSPFEEMHLSNWTDFNPTYKYLKEPERIFMGTTRAEFYTNSTESITINPTELSQKVTLRFKIKPDPKIEITKIIGEISGTVGKIKVLSLEVDESETYRMAFQAKVVEKTQEGIIIYQGEINTLGILRSPSGALISGPGILHLGIYIEKDGLEKVYHERMNLINTLIDAQLTLPISGDGTQIGSRLNPNIKQKTLEIGSELNITMEKISTDNNGTDKWNNLGEDGYIDTEA